MPHTNHYSVSDNRVDITLDDGGTVRSGGQSGFDGEPLDDDSREYIFVARR